jgi:Ni,Fe-hydrogenase III large subunit
VAGDVTAVWDAVVGEVAGGRRFAGLSGTARPAGLVLSAYLAGPDGVATREATLPSTATSYPSLTRRLGAAFWYEREIADMFGLIPQGHPRPEPLLLPELPGDARRPRPGADGGPAVIQPDPRALPRHVIGPGMFTIPHGPVRSGVFESMEYLVETPGEEIPHLNMRVFYKHRGIEKRFEGMTPAGGVLLAERTEGIASVAHALAYCQAIEHITGTWPPPAAALVRVLHAELERLASHLDVIVRLADGAGLAVATARFGWHKELVLRLTGQLSGSRFGRGVVVPGGVSASPALDPAEITAAASALDKQIGSDIRLLMGTASFLDRLRRTGPLRPERAREHGALGPVGRASGNREDVRQARPYAAYDSLDVAVAAREDGDALARLEVRADEIAGSLRLLRQAAGQLARPGRETLRAACAPADGRGTGWTEAAQGEVLYDVRIEDGLITRCRSRSASFHNLVLMHEVFAGDILTDFPFIEASFGLSAAGVSG